MGVPAGFRDKVRVRDLLGARGERTARAFYNLKNRTLERFFFNQLRPSTRGSGEPRPPSTPKKSPRPRGSRRKKKTSAQPGGTSGAKSPERRTRKADRRNETGTNAATGHEDGNETRTRGEPTEPEARQGRRTEPAKRKAKTHPRRVGEPVSAGGAEPPKETGKTGTGRGTADDRRDETGPAENEPDGERTGTERGKQHGKHPRKEKVADERRGRISRGGPALSRSALAAAG